MFQLFPCFAASKKDQSPREIQYKYITVDEIRKVAPKITRIRAIVILCEKEKGRCDLFDYSQYISQSNIKFITREHLNAIFQEQSLALSGLTQEQKTIKIGQLLGASHIMLYYHTGESWSKDVNVYDHKIKIVNISTSEIEYQTSIRESLVGAKWIGREGIVDFFRILNYYNADNF